MASVVLMGCSEQRLANNDLKLTGYVPGMWRWTRPANRGMHLPLEQKTERCPFGQHKDVAFYTSDARTQQSRTSYTCSGLAEIVQMGQAKKVVSTVVQGWYKGCPDSEGLARGLGFSRKLKRGAARALFRDLSAHCSATHRPASLERRG